MIAQDNRDSLARLALRHGPARRRVGAHSSLPPLGDRLAAHCAVFLPDWFLARATAGRMLLLARCCAAMLHLAVLPLRLCGIVIRRPRRIRQTEQTAAAEFAHESSRGRA